MTGLLLFGKTFKNTGNNRKIFFNQLFLLLQTKDYSKPYYEAIKDYVCRLFDVLNICCIGIFNIKIQ